MTKMMAFMPLSTHPEAVSDGAILAALGYGAALGCGVHVGAYSADIPQIYAPIGDVAFDVSGLIEGAQKAGAAEAARLKALVESAGMGASFAYHPHSGGAYQAIPAALRLYDLGLIPWQKGALFTRDIAEAIVFGAGRPVILVPEGAKPAPIHHLAIAWNDSAVAARALNDALPLLAKGGKVSVLCAGSEDKISLLDRASDLVTALAARGYKTEPLGVAHSSKNIAQALQDAAGAAGADLLAMGGFGHSRLRDFVLGGATKGVLDHLTMPVLLSH